LLRRFANQIIPAIVVISSHACGHIERRCHS
jgi:hypothetical protein